MACVSSYFQVQGRLVSGGFGVALAKVAAKIVMQLVDSEQSGSKLVDADQTDGTQLPEPPDQPARVAPQGARGSEEAIDKNVLTDPEASQLDWSKSCFGASLRSETRRRRRWATRPRRTTRTWH